MGDTASSTPRQQTINTIRENLVQLYAQVYRYQIQLALRLDCKGFVGIIRDSLVLDDCSSILEKAERAASNVEREAGQLAVNDVANIYAISRDIQLGQEKDRGDADLERLNQLPYAGDALFDSRAVTAAGRCLEGTHEGALNAIKDWVKNLNGKLMYWLQGLPGTGKSTTALTIAEFLDQEPLGIGLGTSFFFSRADDNRNSGRRFFSTLAWCLGRRVPALRPHIARAILDNTNIPNEDNASQMGRLVLQPIELLEKEYRSPVQLFLVLDALDECNATDAEQILRLLSQLRDLRQIRMRILVTSRSGTFVDNLRVWEEMGNHAYEIARLDKVHLAQVKEGFVWSQDTTEYVADDDITRFMTRRLLDVGHRHRFPDGWITREKFLQLREHTGGLFIYASVACKFFDRPYEEPTDLDIRWKDILYQAQDQGLDEDCPRHHLVNKVYSNVLLSYCKSKRGSEREAARSRIRRILGTMAVLFKPVTVRTLAELLRMPEEGLERQLRPFGSLVIIPPGHESLPLSFVHPTFREYLLGDRYCPTEIFADPGQAHFSVLTAMCFPILMEQLKQNICNLEHPGIFIPEISIGVVEQNICESLAYSCLYWFDHLQNTNPDQRQAILREDAELHQFLKTKFLFWFESLALLGRMDTPVVSLDGLLGQGGMIDKTASPKLHALVRDELSFVRHNRIVAQAPLQIYCSGLIFHPSNSPVFVNFGHLIPDWLEPPAMNQLADQTPIDTSESPLLYALQHYNGTATHLRYSADGRALISWNGTGIWMWDTLSGIVKHSVDPVPGELFTSVCGSSDGNTIAYASPPHSVPTSTIHVRSFTANRTYETTFPLKYKITGIAFLQDNKILAFAFSSDLDVGCALWDIAKGMIVQEFPISRPIRFPSRAPHLFLLGDSGYLAAWIGEEELFQLWDVRAGRLLYNFSIQRPEPLSCGCESLILDYVRISTDRTRLWAVGAFSCTCGDCYKDIPTDEYEHQLFVWQWRDWHLGPVDVPRDLQELLFSTKGPGGFCYGFRDQVDISLRQCGAGHDDLIIAIASATPGEITVVEVTEAKERYSTSFIGHAVRILTLAFSPDGKELASSCARGMVHLWDVQQLFRLCDSGQKHMDNTQ